MVDGASGLGRADAWPAYLFPDPAERSRKPRGDTLSRSGPARLRGARPSSVNSRLACGGTIYDCRRGDLSLGRIAYRAGVRLERLPILACLVRAAFRPARGHSPCCVSRSDSQRHPSRSARSRNQPTLSTRNWAKDRLSGVRSEEHTSELQSLMRISYAVFCLKKNNNTNKIDRENSK